MWTDVFNVGVDVGYAKLSQTRPNSEAVTKETHVGLLVR